MRLVPVSLVASFLVAAVALAPTSRAHDPAPGLEKADQIEAEGRALIERGHRVEGAKTIAQAWKIRAEIWGADQKAAKSEPRPELAALKEKIERMRAASNDAEKEGHELKKAGKVEDAEKKMEESGRLWRQADEMQKKLEAVAAAGAPSKGVAVSGDREREVLELKSRAQRARAEAELEMAVAARAEAEGKETAAKEAMDRAKKHKEQFRALEAAIQEAFGKAKLDEHPMGGIEAKLNALQKQMEAMREIVEELRKRLGDQGK